MDAANEQKELPHGAAQVFLADMQNVSNTAQHRPSVTFCSVHSIDLLALDFGGI